MKLEDYLLNKLGPYGVSEVKVRTVSRKSINVSATARGVTHELEFPRDFSPRGIAASIKLAIET